MTVAAPDSTLSAIRLKIRRLTASPSEQSLSTDIIDQAINTFYQQDFPYAIKLDQMRDTYTFYTQPNVNRYPLNINFNQGIRAPVYFEGIKGFYFKDRDQFYNMWPRWPTINQQPVSTITPQQYSYTISTTPFLPLEVTIGGTDNSNNAISISDDGNGNLLYRNPNPIVPNPTEPTVYPGMVNKNLSNLVLSGTPATNYRTYPGDNISSIIGTVNYVTGAISFDLSLVNITPLTGSQITTWVSQYTVGRPYTLLFWNNYFDIRPVPDNIYKVEVETYLTPVQFLETSDNPIINQWWQYISYGAAMEIIRERQDFDGVEGLREGFMRQEALVLERQGVEEIGQRNTTIFASSQQQQGFNQGFGWPY